MEQKSDKLRNEYLQKLASRICEEHGKPKGRQRIMDNILDIAGFIFGGEYKSRDDLAKKFLLSQSIVGESSKSGDELISEFIDNLDRGLQAVYHQGVLDAKSIHQSGKLLGSMALPHSLIEEYVKELVNKGELPEDNAKAFVKKLESCEEEPIPLDRAQKMVKEVITHLKRQTKKE
jgi:polyhydroxyalkanoate synthesis regulator phasin